VQEVNNAIRRQEIKSRSGTTSDKCGRTGEYDLLLKGYISIYFKYRDLLEPDVRYRVIKLLNKFGPHDPADDTICDGIVGETENHHFNIEASRHLTNQILHVTSGEPDYDNARNGMNEYMLGELQKIFHRDFLEYNSRPYSRYTIIDLQNLTSLHRIQGSGQPHGWFWTTFPQKSPFQRMISAATRHIGDTSLTIAIACSVLARILSWGVSTSISRQQLQCRR
jgi:hypothetical protein